MLGLNIQGFRRMLIGEPMPDRNDPKYKERYERDVKAGVRFAEVTGLAWLGRHYVSWAESNKKTFLVILFALMTFFVVGNLYRFATHMTADGFSGRSAVAQQDSALHHNRFLYNRK